MISPRLEAERELLLTQIDTIRNSGTIAPPNVKIAPDFLNPKCWILNNTTLPMRERQLGQAGSPKYMDWDARIQRRDQLHELEQQLALLQALIERQANADGVFAVHAPIVRIGDAVELDGKPYRVHEIGSSYIQLEDATGVITRCRADQIRLIERAPQHA
jgi:hypothetical protein